MFAQNTNKILPLILITVVLFFPLAGADILLGKARTIEMRLPISISYPSFVILFCVFLPYFWFSICKDGGREIVHVFNSCKEIFVGLGFIVLVHLLYSLHPGSFNEIKKIFIPFYNMVLMVMVMVLCTMDTVKRNHRLIILIIFLGSCASIWLDAINPGLWSKIGHRAAGFNLNPNRAALNTLLLCIATVDWKKPSSKDLIIFGVAGVTIFTTISVGVSILYFIFLGFYGFFVLKNNWDRGRKIVMWGSTLVLILILMVPVLTALVKELDMFQADTTQKRLEQIDRLISGDASFAKNHERTELIFQFWEDISEAPFVGHGLGYYVSEARVGPHNMFIYFWACAGILGLFSYVIFLAMPFKFFLQKRHLGGIMLMSLFFFASFYSQGLLKDDAGIIMIGMQSVFAIQNYQKSEIVLNHPEKEMVYG